VREANHAPSFKAEAYDVWTSISTALLTLKIWYLATGATLPLYSKSTAPFTTKKHHNSLCLSPETAHSATITQWHKRATVQINNIVPSPPISAAYRNGTSFNKTPPEAIQSGITESDTRFIATIFSHPEITGQGQLVTPI
jgi:hypothetical protein